MRAVPSSLAVTTSSPDDVNCAETTASVSPAKVASAEPVLAFHVLAVRSRLAVVTCVPSGLNAMSVR